MDAIIKGLVELELLKIEEEMERIERNKKDDYKKNKLFRI